MNYNGTGMRGESLRIIESSWTGITSSCDVWKMEIGSLCGPGRCFRAGRIGSIMHGLMYWVLTTSWKMEVFGNEFDLALRGCAGYRIGRWGLRKGRVTASMNE